MTMSRVQKLRVVVTADDFDQAVAFYRDVLGLTEQAAFHGDGDARVVILDAGHATLELANPAQAAMIDGVEVGQRVSPHIRLAFEVDDARAATAGLSAAGTRSSAGLPSRRGIPSTPGCGHRRACSSPCSRNSATR